MHFLPKLVVWEMTILVAGFFGVVFWKILTGSVTLDCLLHGDDANGTTSFSAGRAQLLVVTLMVAVQYLTQVIGNPTKFPDIPKFWIVALGGSQAAYLAGKAWSLLSGGQGPMGPRQQQAPQSQQAPRQPASPQSPQAQQQAQQQQQAGA